jgi:DNA-binding FrmR family transcriptional regulator
MVLEERDCREVLQQIAAIRAAARSLGALVVEHYLLSCLEEGRAAPEESLTVLREAIRGIAH